jgi:hypothetical protein
MFRMGNKGNGAFSNNGKGPGPGDYNYNSTFNKIKGPATFGRYSRIQLALNSSKSLSKNGDGSRLSKSMLQFPPGPGAYNADYRTVTRNDPRGVIGTAGRDRNSFYDS